MLVLGLGSEVLASGLVPGLKISTPKTQPM